MNDRRVNLIVKIKCKKICEGERKEGECILTIHQNEGLIMSLAYGVVVMGKSDWVPLAGAYSEHFKNPQIATLMWTTLRSMEDES